MSPRTLLWSWASIVAAAALLLSVPAWAAARPDAWITTKTKISLLTTDGVSGTAINVDTTDGRVTLHGTVSSAQEKAKADQLALGGVRSVSNQLEVVAEANAERVAAKDSDVESAIETRLGARGDLADADIDVEVSNGVARLTGSVDSQSDRMTALTVARATSGVRAVLDELELEPPAVSSR